MKCLYFDIGEYFLTFEGKDFILYSMYEKYINLITYLRKNIQYSCPEYR